MLLLLSLYIQSVFNCPQPPGNVYSNNIAYRNLIVIFCATGCSTRFLSLGKFKYTRHLSGILNQRCETLYLLSLPSYSGGLHHRCSHFRNEQSQRPGAAHFNTNIQTFPHKESINKDFFENYDNTEYEGDIWDVYIF